ncbi:MAG: GatB/YqeY domain-containing protein [Parcubacteria group bacterium]|nr:GatB/YqeY domain-containing protein [Parcubacteria group bacterium]
MHDEKGRLVLGSLLAVIQNKEIEKRSFAVKKNLFSSQEELVKASELSDDDVIQVIQSEVKKRKEAVELFRKGNRDELAQKEEDEIIILSGYLPEQLNEEELKEIVRNTINELGAKDVKEMGRVINTVMQKVKGRADGSMVSRLAKDLLVS